MSMAVTGFVPIPDHPRPAEEYHRLAVPLRMLSLEGLLMTATVALEDCWLYQYLKDFSRNGKVTWAVSDNPRKNSLAYHIVQAQKTELLALAAQACNMKPDVYVWIDYGIFHVPGVTSDIIRKFIVRAAGEQAIAVPGCWEPQQDHDEEQPNWRFCGGVMVVPRAYVLALDYAMKQEYVRWLRKYRHVTWEVNTLARVEHREPDLPIWWYKAGHDASIFTNYQATEHAEGQTSARLNKSSHRRAI